MKLMKWLSYAALVFFCVAFTTAPLKKTIVIDAGHGGDDHGATHNEISEKKLVLAISEKIKMYSANHELVNIVLLRESDQFMSTTDRIEKINNLHPDLVISLHINFSLNRKETGARALIAKNGIHSETSKLKADHLLNAISNKRIQKKEIKEASIEVLNRVNCPALFLELGYMTNDVDRAYLSSESGQDEIAKNITNYCLSQR